MDGVSVKQPKYGCFVGATVGCIHELQRLKMPQMAFSETSFIIGTVSKNAALAVMQSAAIRSEHGESTIETAIKTD